MKTILGTFVASLLLPPAIQAQPWVPERIYGLRGFAGTNATLKARELNVFPNDKKIQHFLLHPYAGSRFEDWFEIGLEGVFGTLKYGQEKYAAIFGATLNVYADLFKIRENKIFAGFGVGLSYWNKSIIDGDMVLNHKELPAITHVEVGLKRPFKYNGRDLEFIISFRFSHTSAMKDERNSEGGLDDGVNTAGITLGINWLDCGKLF